MHPLMVKWLTLCVIAACFGSIAMVCAGALPFGPTWWLIELGGWGGCAYWGYHAHQVMKEMTS